MSLFGSGGTAFGSNAQSQTGSTPSFGTTNAQQSSSPFAQPASTTSQQGGSLFGSASSTQPQAGASLFGAATAASQPAQQLGTGASFTSNPNAGQTSTGNSLFGSAPQTQQSASLFGNSQSRPNQQTGGGGLFGTAQSSQPQQQQGGLFGNAQTQQPSLFGPKAAQSSNNSLFGSSSAVAPPSMSLVGSTTNNNQRPPHGSNFAGLTLGQAARQAQVVPGVRIDASNIRSTTRFNDLHEDIQSQIEKIDTFIQQQIQFKEQCDAMMPNHEANLKTVPEDVALVNGLVDVAELGILNDSTSIKSAKDLLQGDADAARISFRAIETLKLPSQLRHQNTWYSNAPRRDLKPSIDEPSTDEAQPQDIVEYFASEARRMTSTLRMYENYISEIEGHLQNVETSTLHASRRRQLTLGNKGSVQSAEDQIRELTAVLKEFEGGIYGVAAKVGDIQDETQKLIMQPKRRV